MTFFHESEHYSLYNWPVFSPKPPFGSEESQLSSHEVTYTPANAPVRLLRRIL